MPVASRKGGKRLCGKMNGGNEWKGVKPAVQNTWRSAELYIFLGEHV